MVISVPDDLTTPADAARRAVGKRIRAGRQALDITQQALAAHCFVSQPAVSQWEKGTTLPARPTQHRLADLLRTPRHILFAEVDALEANE
jgi:transcriptional regulator with XRE-family HTH domain